MRKPPATMTAGELIEALEYLSEDTPVYFAYKYGDICGTMAIAGIDSVDDDTPLEESGYSDSGWAIAEDPEDEPDKDDPNEPDSDPEERPKAAVIR